MGQLGIYGPPIFTAVSATLSWDCTIGKRSFGTFCKSCSQDIRPEMKEEPEDRAGIYLSFSVWVWGGRTPQCWRDRLRHKVRLLISGCVLVLTSAFPRGTGESRADHEDYRRQFSLAARPRPGY